MTFYIPNAEKAAKTALEAVLGVPVFVTVPRNPPREYVRVSRMGGAMRDLVTDGALLAVEAYAPTAFRAGELANRARAVMWGTRASWVGDIWVRWWEESAGPAYFSDPDTSLFRYMFTGVLTVATNNGPPDSG